MAASDDPNVYCPVGTSLSSFTLRRAIDPAGVIGSLYDACCDRLVGSSRLNLTKISSRLVDITICFMKRYDSEKMPYLSELVSTHPELQLSIAVQSVQGIRVDAVNDYPHTINKYTRFIHYEDLSRKDDIADNDYQQPKRTLSIPNSSTATHVVVSVKWGIDTAIIVQLPPVDDLTVKIDNAINKMCTILSGKNTHLTLSTDDKDYLEQIARTIVISNIPRLCDIKSLVEFYHKLPKTKDNRNEHPPYNYILYPVGHFLTPSYQGQGIHHEIPTDYNDAIRRYLLQLSTDFRKLRRAINQPYPNFEEHLHKQFRSVQEKWSKLELMYTDEIVTLRKLVIGVRRREIDQAMICAGVDSNQKRELEKNIEDLRSDLGKIERKEQCLRDLLNRQIKFRNAKDYGLTDGNDEQIIMQKLSVNTDRELVICSNDHLYNTQRDEMYEQLRKKQQNNPQLQPVYVDFSSCSPPITEFIILPKPEKNKQPDAPEPSVPSTSRPTTSRRSKVSDEFYNILLIGESGVGKSTFVNAFVNYLQFDTLEEAQHDPIAVIPVSFVMTTGDNFDERLVQFGGEDTLKNEDHDHAGQSVTQHCRSYVVRLDYEKYRGKKLRIIDTPGSGDVRGTAQDDLNIQDILSYISNLTHLNAVCILLKPNNARLNIVFRSCFVQLIDLLSERACKRIVFCFTNSRSTFYSPGDTGPLLKQMLASLPVKGTLFAKINTFCFDSESFRYLVAKKNGIEFNDAQEKEYEDSWNKSSSESKRLLNYISTELSDPLIPDDSKSVQHAQIKIRVLIRPMLEAIRNTLRNIILDYAGSHSMQIELSSKEIQNPTGICTKCPADYQDIVGFRVRCRGLHVFHNVCRTCRCSQSDHYRIDYEVTYKEADPRSTYSIDKMKDTLKELLQTCVEFGSFLSEKAVDPKNDLFSSDFDRIIKEERAICEQNDTGDRNKELLREIEKVKAEYEQMLINAQRPSLSDIYTKIEEIKGIPMIKVQMAAIEKWQKQMMKLYENEVSM